MKIPQHKIEEVATATDIVDVISQYTPLRKSGRSFMGRCPFHEEKTPSFSVSQEKGVYHCFGCGKSGNVFTFLMDIDNISFTEAVKLLADKANVKIIFEDDGDRNTYEVLYEINTRAARFFHDTLMGDKGVIAKEYFHTRNIEESFYKTFGLGYSPREKDSLVKELSKDFSNDDLILSGVAVSLGTNDVRDRFRGRLMFPILSESGKVVGFGGRRLQDSGDDAKYINTNETPIYNKSRILYGLNFSKNHIRKERFAFLVEGYMDFIQLYQHEIQNVVASSGTSLTPQQIKTLSRYTDEVVVLYDSDFAGESAARRALELLLEGNMKVNILSLPEGNDPDSYLNKYGTEKFKAIVNTKQNVIEFIGNKLQKEGKLESPEGKAEFVKEIIVLIAKIRDEIRRDFYIKDISERFSIYESSVRKELSKIGFQRSQGKPNINSQQNKNTEPEQRAELKIPQAEINLIRLLVDSDDETKKFIHSNLEISHVKDSFVIKIISFIISLSESDKITHINLFNNFNDVRSRDILGKALLDENYVMMDNKKSSMKDAKMLLNSLKLSNLKENINSLKSKYNSESNIPFEVMKKIQDMVNERLLLEKSLRGS